MSYSDERRVIARGFVSIFTPLTLLLVAGVIVAWTSSADPPVKRTPPTALKVALEDRSREVLALRRVLDKKKAEVMPQKPAPRPHREEESLNAN